MLLTSLNIHVEIMREIEMAAKAMKTSRKAVIILVLTRLIHDIDWILGGFTTVKYQPADPGKRWRCFVIRFKPDEYEFWSDMRRLSKFSVSFLVAIAVKVYLESIVEEKYPLVNNYFFPENYLLRHEMEDGIRCWHFCWGIPKGQGEKNPPSRLIRSVLRL
jgi:hypothetical protein